jgi:hypothetical protein
LVANIYPHISISGKTQIVTRGGIFPEIEGVCIHLNLHGYYKERDAIKVVSKLIDKSDISWIKPNSNGWKIDTDKAKERLPDFKKLNWFKGELNIIPDFEIDESVRFGKHIKESVYRLFILKEEILMNSFNKVFLSHKSENKPLIREYNKSLELLGYDTWLDEDAMNAGASLDRSLLKGMKDSCAAVFFITPEYIDDRYLQAEIDYAVAQKMEKGEDFQIITLALRNEAGELGNVPELLRRYVWKEPSNPLEGLREIIKSIPLKLQKPIKER